MVAKKRIYNNADAWRQAAMQRPGAIDAIESRRRQTMADAHNRQCIADADTLADQQLYIQGKMDIEEYQDYLLYKQGAGLNSHERA